MAASNQSEDGQFKLYIYRPQRKVKFSEASVGHSLSGGGLPLGEGGSAFRGDLPPEERGLHQGGGGQSSQPGSDI